MNTVDTIREPVPPDPNSETLSRAISSSNSRPFVTRPSPQGQIPGRKRGGIDLRGRREGRKVEVVEAISRVGRPNGVEPLAAAR